MPISGNKSTKPLPFRYTIRIASIKYFKGLNTVIACEDYFYKPIYKKSCIIKCSVNSPLINIRINMKKNITNIDCCIVAE